MSALLVDLPQPGAISCIVVGQLDAIDPARLAACRDILWCGAALVVPPAYVGRVALLTPGAPDLVAQIERFLRRNPRRLPTLLVTADAGSPAYAEVLADIHATLESAHRTRLTRQKDGFTWQRHVLQNVPAYLRHRLPPTHPPARVLLASVSPPAWRDYLPGNPPLFLSGPQVTDDWLATQGVARTALAVSESCGRAALALAAHLGRGPISLFGPAPAAADTDPARRHQKDADPALYHASHYDPTARLPRVPGNYAETVPCFALGDWRALDARLADHPHGHVFNITDRGARLRGTTAVHPGQFNLPAPAVEKAPLLARLTAPPSAHPAALARLAALGARAEAALPELRRAFAVGGPAELAAAFRPLVTDPDLGRALGAFSLKLMPNLVPPTEGDRTFWAALLEEYVTLVPLLRNASC